VRKARDRKRHLSLGWALLLFAGFSVAGDAHIKREWVPTLKDIAELESKVRMPEGAAPLKNFTREYAGKIENGHRVIVGVYSGAGRQVVIVKSTKELLSTLDGGCSIVEVSYDLTNHRVIEAICNGEA
jgi:hypothetical protein